MRKYITVLLSTCLITFTNANAQNSTPIPNLSEVGSHCMPQEIAPIQNSYFNIPQLKRPQFPDRTVNMGDKGLRADIPIHTLVNRTIEQLSSQGGGTVIIPAGKWISGRIELKSFVELHIARGAEIVFGGCAEDYLPAVFTRHEGVEIMGPGAFIYANNQENIAITGEGRILGPDMDAEIRKRPNGASVVEKDIPWDMPVEQRIYDGMDGRTFYRPKTISPINCRNVLIEGITMERSTLWNVVPIYCENVIIRGITVNSTEVPDDSGNVRRLAKENIVFSIEALKITKDEYPYEGRPVAVADVHSAGVAEHYDVVYGWPGDDEKLGRPKQCIFTREFGENVDDWYAHNNNNRACRGWGERPQLVQALSLAKSYDEMYRTTGQFIGGAQWHPFDHQRGYHPDPYFGGIYDAFRQPKYAYEMFRSQSPAHLNHPIAESGPMIYIAHEMSPFSDADVVVFSNCDSVRLSVYDGTKSWVLPVVHAKGHMPNAPVVFKNVWNFWEAREFSYKQKNWQKVNMVAEGIIDGKVVCTTKRMPSRRSTKLRLKLDTEGKQLVADGSDFIVVVAEVTDDSGNVRRLAKENIVFSIEGEQSHNY